MPSSSDLITNGPLRRVYFLRFANGDAPARDFVEDLGRKRTTSPVASDFYAACLALASHEKASSSKPWDPSQGRPLDPRTIQFRCGKYRFIAIGDHLKGQRVLLIMMGFKKHTKKTPRSAQRQIIKLHKRYRGERS